MSRVSAKRTVAIAALAGLALLSMLCVAALEGSDSAVTRLLGIQGLSWALPLTAGAAIGLAAWALLEDSAPSIPDSPHEETVCASCGRTILKDWRLCPHCGAFTAPEAQSAARVDGPA